MVRHIGPRALRPPARSKAAAREDSPRVCQVRITLLGIEPSIWRRVQVPATISLRRLHDVIQAAMGWTDSHLHQFEAGGRQYGITDAEVDPPPDLVDDRRVTLASVAGSAGVSWRYEYDFGDGWEHEILVEDVRPAAAAARQAVCLDGARACPPEDCGGAAGYQENLLPALKARRPTADQRELLDWMGGRFDPVAFDLDAANRRLRRVKLS